MPDIWDPAWAEAEASCSAGVLMYETLELQHPAFLEAGVPIALRFTLGKVARSFGIEATATFNPGTMQTFTPITFTSKRPDFEQGKVPECRVSFDNVGRTLMPYLNAAVKVRADLVLIYRQYLDDDVSQPSEGPYQFIIRNVRTSGSRVEGTAKLTDLANMKFLRRVYTRKQFPALVA